MTQSGEPSEIDHPGVVAPPPLIFGGVLLLMLAFDLLVGGPDFKLPTNPQMTTGLILVLAGFVMIMIAAFQFRLAKTNIEPWKPTIAIITSGLYRISRNPIYLGLAILYLGLSLLSDRLLTLAGFPLALAIIHYGVILREEHYLEVKFGQVYRDYKARTRRWI